MWIFKKYVLSVNELFIDDRLSNIKYYWDDIEEAVETEGVLEIKLHDPVKYLDAIRNPFGRLYAKFACRFFKKKPSFKIDLSYIKSPANDSVLNILNDFSIKAEG